MGGVFHRSLVLHEVSHSYDVAGSHTWSDILRGSDSGVMYDSVLVVGSGSFITAGSVPPSAVGSGIVSVQRDGGWLFSGCETVRVGNGDVTVLEHPNTPTGSSVWGGGEDAPLVSPFLFIVFVLYSELE